MTETGQKTIEQMLEQLQRDKISFCLVFNDKYNSDSLVTFTVEKDSDGAKLEVTNTEKTVQLVVSEAYEKFYSIIRDGNVTMLAPTLEAPTPATELDDEVPF